MFFAIRRKTYIFAEIPDVMDKRLTDKIVRYFATQPVVKAWVFEFSNGVKREDFQKDSILYFAIVKNIEIIGEASYMLSLDFKDAHPDTITPQPNRQSSWSQKRN